MTESISSSTGSNYLSMMQSASGSTSSKSKTEKEEEMTSDEILNELKQDGLSSTMTAQDIADEYGISLSEAQEILDELNSTDNEIPSEYTIDNPIPEDSTISYHV